MLKIKIIIPVIIILLVKINFTASAQQKVNWNGYLQYRFSDDYLDQTNFSVRRAKFWIDGKLPFASNEWSFKLQSIFLNKQSFLFELQDVCINYQTQGLTIIGGQFVPDFSLQRKQPDYVIPLTERANVINALIPTAETMGRDIGIELKHFGRYGGISFGFFNGNGANTLSDKKNFLYINRTYLKLDNGSDELQIGYSLSYRNDNQLKFSKILGSSVVFSGSDFRYGFDLRLKISGFEFQSEYLEAHLKNQKSWGYYALSDYRITKQNLLTISLEQFHDLISSTSDNPWFKLGYTYYIKDNYIKLSFDNGFQFLKNKTNSLTTIQIQYFFNQ